MSVKSLCARPTYGFLGGQELLLVTHEEGMLHYEAGHYELHGYPLRPSDVIEVLTDSGWIAGYLAYERGWYWVAPGGSMVRVSEEMQARFQRQYLRAGWESEDRYDSELLIERWRNGELDEEESMPLVRVMDW